MSAAPQHAQGQVPLSSEHLADSSSSASSALQSTTARLEALHSYPIIVRELIAGGVAGATAKSSVAPLERCKILFQTGKLHRAGIISTLRSIVQTEGPRGLFRGNGAAVLRIIPYSSIHFGLYEHYRRIVVTSVYGEGEDSHGVTPIVDLVSGSAAGATAVLVTYPLDLVRTRLAYISEAGSVKKAKTAISEPGMPLSNAPSAASGSLLNNNNSTATTARLKSHDASTPIKRALHGFKAPDPNHTIRGVLSSTLRQEGLRGLYHGIGPSMYGILPYAGLKFYVYQHLKQAYLGMMGRNAVVQNDLGTTSGSTKVKCGRLPVPAMLAFGGIAGLIAQTATFPLDVVRRRMQVEGLKRRQPPVGLGPPHFPEPPLPQSTPAALMAIARSQGWRALFAGLSINYMKVVPSTAIGFTLYDYLKAALDLPTHL